MYVHQWLVPPMIRRKPTLSGFTHWHIFQLVYPMQRGCCLSHVSGQLVLTERWSWQPNVTTIPSLINGCMPRTWTTSDYDSRLVAIELNGHKKAINQSPFYTEKPVKSVNQEIRHQSINQNSQEWSRVTELRCVNCTPFVAGWITQIRHLRGFRKPKVHPLWSWTPHRRSWCSAAPKCRITWYSETQLKTGELTLSYWLVQLVSIDGGTPWPPENEWKWMLNRESSNSGG